MSNDPVVSFVSDHGKLRIRIDREGTAAQSAPVGDPLEFIRMLAEQADLEYDDAQLPDSIVVSVPPGS